MPIGLKGNSDGSGAIQIGGSDAISISTGLNTTFAGTITASGGVMYPLVSGTAVASTSGTAIDFTGIPSWAKRITVMFSGVSTNGSAGLQIQIGDSGGIETTGYIGSSGTQANSTAFTLNGGSSAAATTYSGIITLSNISGNNWCQAGTLGRGDGVTTIASGGSKTLSDVLTQARVTTSNGTDTFDAGTINILYE